LGQRVLQGRLALAQATAEPVDERGHGVDGHLGLTEIGRALGHVEGGEVEQPHGVVGDDDLGRHLGQAPLHLRHLGRHRVHGLVVVEEPIVGAGRLGRRWR